MSGDRRTPRWGIRFDGEATMDMPPWDAETEAADRAARYPHRNGSGISALPQGRGRRGRRTLAIAPPPPEPVQEQPPADQYGRPARRYRHADAALFDLTDGGFVLTCGLDTSHHHGGPADQEAFYVFDTLRATAHDAGWRLDANGLWCCPRCQMTRRFRTLAPVTLRADGAAQAHMDGDPGLELWLSAVAEQALREDVAAAAEHDGRHAMDGAQ